MARIIDTLALSGFWAGVKTRLNNKADASHSHVIADVASLQTLLDGKANSAHTHTIANVTGLQEALTNFVTQDDLASLATKTELAAVADGLADPVVELAQAVADLQDADLDIREAGRATAHLIDPAKDLIAEADTLYRLTHVIEDGLWVQA